MQAMKSIRKLKEDAEIACTSMTPHLRGGMSILGSVSVSFTEFNVPFDNYWVGEALKMQLTSASFKQESFQLERMAIFDSFDWVHAVLYIDRCAQNVLSFIISNLQRHYLRTWKLKQGGLFPAPSVGGLSHQLPNSSTPRFRVPRKLVKLPHRPLIL
jgi:hypothetical protein